MLKWCDPEALIGGCATYDEEMRRFLEEAKALRSFYDVMAAFKDFIRALPESCKGVRAVVDPSIQSMLRISAFYGTRVTNPRKRQKVLEFCMDAIKPVVTEMCDGTAKVFEKLRG